MEIVQEIEVGLIGGGVWGGTWGGFGGGRWCWSSELAKRRRAEPVILSDRMYME